MSNALDKEQMEVKENGGGLFVPPELVKVIVGFCSPTLLLSSKHDEPDQVIAEHCVEQERLLSNLRFVSRAFKDSVDRLDVEGGLWHNGPTSFAARVARHLFKVALADNEIASAAPLLGLLKSMIVEVSPTDDIAVLNTVLSHCRGLEKCYLRVDGSTWPKEGPSISLPLGLTELAFGGVGFATSERDWWGDTAIVNVTGITKLANVGKLDLCPGKVLGGLDFRDAEALESLVFVQTSTRRRGRQDAWDSLMSQFKRLFPRRLTVLSFTSYMPVTVDLKQLLEDRQVSSLSVKGAIPTSFNLGVTPSLQIIDIADYKDGLEPGMLADLSIFLAANSQVQVLNLKNSRLDDSHLAQVDLRDSGIVELDLSSNAFTEAGLRSCFARLPSSLRKLDLTGNAHQLCSSPIDELRRALPGLTSIQQ